MNDRQINDRDIQAAFRARAEGSPSPDLAERIQIATRQTRQRRRLALLPGLPRHTQRLLWAAVISATSLALVGGLLLAGRQNDDRISVLPSPSSSPSLEPSSSPSLEPSPSASATTSATPFAATLIVDTFAAVVGDSLVPVSGGPGGARLPQYDYVFSSATPLVVIDGPVVVDNVEWYYFAYASRVIDSLPGWAPIQDPDGTQWIVPTTLTCLSSPMTTEQIQAEHNLRNGLPICYGDTEITIVGGLGCGAATDPLISGASWMENGWVCRLDTLPEGIAVYGTDLDAGPGRYAVTGHFDDAEARECHWPEFGEGSDAEPMWAVMECRSAFVATSILPDG